jgi:hypothetical protein
VNAFSGDVLAAFAVLTFALTATFIPMYAATSESNAPEMKEKTVSNPKIAAIGNDSKVTRSKIVLYCLFRKVLAPILTYLAVSRI